MESAHLSADDAHESRQCSVRWYRRAVEWIHYIQLCWPACLSRIVCISSVDVTNAAQVLERHGGDPEQVAGLAGAYTPFAPVGFEDDSDDDMLGF